MEIETYEIEDRASELSANGESLSEEALALIETLGLDGQRELVAKQSSGTEVVERRIPYREMETEEFRIYATLCPKRRLVGAYSDSMIPLRVLQVAAHAIDLFDKVEVWAPETRTIDDPVLVGVKTVKGSYGMNETKHFILARWGVTLQPLSELRPLAVEKLVSDTRAKLEKGMAECTAFLSTIDSQIDSYIRGNRIDLPSVHLFL